MSRRAIAKEIAKETVRILEKGDYLYRNKRVDIKEMQTYSEENTVLITPKEGEELLKGLDKRGKEGNPRISVSNEATVKAVLDFSEVGVKNIGVLNFASAKNPGGGFLNGAMAQEESIAASSGLYHCQLKQYKYYDENQAYRSMMYTDYAIYSPDVVLLRDDRFQLIEDPVSASVLTLPAVNYGQVLRKGEDAKKAKEVMKKRMKLSLAIFAAKGDKNLILGAYGCGVFGNDPVDVAGWWHELLFGEGYGKLFESIRFAVLDNSKDGACIRSFTKILGPYCER